jgi:hypothetical protein
MCVSLNIFSPGQAYQSGVLYGAYALKSSLTYLTKFKFPHRVVPFVWGTRGKKASFARFNSAEYAC